MDTLTHFFDQILDFFNIKSGSNLLLRSVTIPLLCFVFLTFIRILIEALVNVITSYKEVKSVRFLLITKYILGDSTLDRFITGFSAKLADYVVDSIIKSQQTKIKKSNILDSTVVGMLIGKKAKQNTLAYLCLSVSFLIYFASSYIFGFELDNLVISFISLLIIAVYLNRKMLEIRVSKDLYGSNEYEAREIINFILNHCQKSDFSDGEGLKKLLPNPNTNIDSETVRADNLGGVPAGV